MWLKSRSYSVTAKSASNGAICSRSMSSCLIVNSWASITLLCLASCLLAACTATSMLSCDHDGVFQGWSTDCWLQRVSSAQTVAQGVVVMSQPQVTSTVLVCVVKVTTTFGDSLRLYRQNVLCHTFMCAAAGQACTVKSKGVCT